MSLAAFLNFVYFVFFVVQYFELAGESLDFCFGMVAEVNNQAEPVSCGFEVVEHLGLMFRRDGFDGFKFQDDQAEADDVRLVGLLQQLAFVGELQLLLGNKGNAAPTKFPFQAFLIDRLKEAAAHLAVNFKNGTLNRIDLVFKQEFFGECVVHRW